MKFQPLAVVKCIAFLLLVSVLVAVAQGVLHVPTAIAYPVAFACGGGAMIYAINRWDPYR